MRFEGMLKTWDDERGFGFIEPTQGGQEIFAHIKSFGTRAKRPQVGQRLSFEIEVSPKGKRARKIEFVRAAATHARARHQPHGLRGGATLLALPAFAVLFITAGVLWRPPAIVFPVYVVASVLAFLGYWSDKEAARRGTWRTPESSLHLLALAGGWPGALLAQQFLRHKSTKAEFRMVFWVTVILNVAGFLLFCSPMGRSLWRSWGA